MPAPIMTLFHDDSSYVGGTPLDGSNPLDFGGVDKGTASTIQTIHVWNGKNDPSVDTANDPLLFSFNGSAGDASPIFNGTSLNNYKSMLEARSCAAIGVSADQQKAWTPISPTLALQLGDMPANSMRTVEVRLNIPLDAPDMALTSWSLRVSV